MTPPPFSHKKSLGQHFLTSDAIPQVMANAAGLSAGDAVLEIGPGSGMLTRTLLRRGAIVTALEADRRALSLLHNTFADKIRSGQLTLHHGDARAYNAGALGLHDREFTVIANIPYYLSGRLFRLLLAPPVQPRAMVLLVQKEVARRVTALSQQSLLSLSVAVYGTARYVTTVSRSHFTPPPSVCSGVVHVFDIHNPFSTPQQAAWFFTLLRCGFAQKRKQLGPLLAHTYGRDNARQALEKAEVSYTARAEAVPLHRWKHIAIHLEHV